MATLTETAYYTRRAINWGIIALVVIFIFKIFLDFTVSAWKKLFPPPPPPPTVAFGKLPALKFPPAPGDTPSAQFSFTLETIEGEPPATSSAGTVFFIPKPEPNLLSLSRASQFASRLGFRGEPQAESPTVYRWSDEKNPFKTLRIDIVTGNFKITYDYAQDLGLFAEKNLPTQDQAIAEATNFLQNLGLFPSELQAGQTQISYWQLLGNTLVQTTSLAGADAVRVDFSRENILGMRLFSSHPPEELIYFIFSGSREAQKRILEVSYRFWTVEMEQGATYPLKTSSQAWEELIAGKGYIARLAEGENKVVVRKIYLAYFYPEDYQSFLQPIFVFEGDPNFLAFIPAVSPAWVEQ